MDFDDILRDFEKEVRPHKVDELENRQSDLARLTKVWVHERLAPELLPYEGELIERILEGMRQQTEFVEANSMELSKEKDIKLKLLIVESELERVSFLIRSYLRTRLSKIDEFAMFIRNDEEMIGRLSNSETKYMENHLKSLVELYNSSFLSSLPSHLQILDDTAGGISMIDEPNLNTPVFIRVEKTIDIAVVVGDEEVELIEGSIYLLRYSAIKQFLYSGEVVLV